MIGLVELVAPKTFYPYALFRIDGRPAGSIRITEDGRGSYTNVDDIALPLGSLLPGQLILAQRVYIGPGDTLVIDWVSS